MIKINNLQSINELNNVIQQWNQLSRKVLKGFDLTYPQFRVLNGLVELGTEKRIAQTQLAKHIHMDNMTLSTIIRNLESRRLVRRIESRSDTRAKNIYLTSFGMDLVDEAAPALEYTADEYLRSKPLSHELLKNILNLHDFTGLE